MKLFKKRPVGRPAIHPNNAERCRAYRKRKKEAAHWEDLIADPSHETPQDFFDKLNAEFHFTLDVCALPNNAKCPRYFTLKDNGLLQDWGREICWCNPPYGRGKTIEKWVRKAYESAKTGATVVCLLPSSTDTYWFHHIVLLYAADIRYVEGRLKFGKAPDNARFANMVVIFRPRQPMREVDL